MPVKTQRIDLIANTVATAASLEGSDTYETSDRDGAHETESEREGKNDS